MNPRSRTRRQSQRRHPSRLVLTHESRRLPSWLIFDVGQKMNRSQLLRPRTPKQWLICYTVMFWAAVALVFFFASGALWLAFSVRNFVGAIGFVVIAAIECFVALVLRQRATAFRHAMQTQEPNLP
jgi:hypothetical protein